MVDHPRPPTPDRDESRQPAVTATRVVFAVTGAAALVLGYVGMGQYLTRIDSPARGV